MKFDKSQWSFKLTFERLSLQAEFALPCVVVDECLLLVLQHGSALRPVDVLDNLPIQIAILALRVTFAIFTTLILVMNVELLLFELVPSDLVQYPVVVEVGPRVEPSKHLIGALRRLLRR